MITNLRHRKARGKQPAAVTFTQTDLLVAAKEFLEKRGYVTARTSAIKFVSARTSKNGKKLPSKVEVIIDIEEFPT